MFALYNEYNRITQAIKWTEEQIALNNRERNFWTKNVRTASKFPTITAIAHADRLAETIEELYNVLDFYTVQASVIEKLVAGAEGLEFDVAYKRMIEGKSLREIAEETNYSYDHIRRINSRIQRDAVKPVYITAGHVAEPAPARHKEATVTA